MEFHQFTSSSWHRKLRYHSVCVSNRLKWKDKESCVKQTCWFFLRNLSYHRCSGEWGWASSYFTSHQPQCSSYFLSTCRPDHWVQDWTLHTCCGNHRNWSVLVEPALYICTHYRLCEQFLSLGHIGHSFDFLCCLLVTTLAPNLFA